MLLGGLIAQWKKEGVLLDFSMANPGDPNWRAFLKFRAASRQEVDALLHKLPLIDYLQFEVTELAKLGWETATNEHELVPDTTL